MTESVFSAVELERYNRHLIIPGFGEQAQAALKSAKVLVTGCGGLGSPLLLYLAAAGVGTIGLVDFDRVDSSNLQRQVLFSVEDVGQPKVMAAKRRLEALNPFIKIVPYPLLLDAQNILEVIAGYDVIADGTDNFPTRFLINDAAFLAGKPLVYGSVFQFEGQVSVFNTTDAEGVRGPNYRDIYPAPPPAGVLQNCAEGGVLGVLPGIIGSMQALEVIKLITGLGDTLGGKLYLFDALSMEGRKFTIKKNELNPLHAGLANLQALNDYDDSCRMKQLPRSLKEITVKDFAHLQASDEPYQLVDVRERAEYEALNIGGALMPLSELAAHVHEIESGKKVIVHCRSGVRSAQAIRLLEDEYGLTNLYNLQGGIVAYLNGI